MFRYVQVLSFAVMQFYPESYLFIEAVPRVQTQYTIAMEQLLRILHVAKTNIWSFIKGGGKLTDSSASCSVCA